MIDPNCKVIGKHRETLSRKKLKAWLDRVGLPYRSPHKFRHGHIQYGISHAKTLADFKAVSLNVLHSSMGITDEIYSLLGDREIQNRIGLLSQTSALGKDEIDKELADYREYLLWRKRKIDN